MQNSAIDGGRGSAFELATLILFQFLQLVQVKTQWDVVQMQRRGNAIVQHK